MSRLVTRDPKFHAAVKKAGGPHTKYGAGLLADHINAFWASRAKGVKAERYELDAGLGWGVRSNLVDGLPPVRKQQPKAGPAKSIEARRAEFLA